MDNTLIAQWCRDSDTGEWVLVDLKTGTIVLRKNEKGELIDVI